MISYHIGERSVYFLLSLSLMWDEANSGFPQDFKNLANHLAVWKHNACFTSIFVIGSKIMRSSLGNETS
jgi:hypothetical protein